MSTPPRRRRPESRRSQPKEGGGWLPTIAMGLGVIVAGLGIGALVAVLMQRNVPGQRPVAVVTSTPAPASPTRAPVAIATIEPPRTPRPTPSSLPSLTPSAAPSPSPEATAAPTVRSSPRSAPVAMATASASGVPAPDVSVARAVADTPTPVASRVETPSASATASAGAVPSAATPAVAASAAASTGAVSTYEQHASGVVRSYLDALIRGDEKAAYRALGESAGTAPGSLTERSFIDSGARIVSLKVTRIDASNASVGCEIAAAKGHYYATYHVTAGSSGPYISEHDYIKV